jgi:hypothetical protein
MRVKLVVSNASNLPKSPCVVSPVSFNAISKVNCVSSSPVVRSSWLYNLVTARAVRRRFAQAQGNTGKVRSDSFDTSVLTLHVYTFIMRMSIESWPFEVQPLLAVRNSRQGKLEALLGAWRRLWAEMITLA